MRTAICFENIKQASLYFDRVLPFGLRGLQGTSDGELHLDYAEQIPCAALTNIVLDAPASATHEGRFEEGLNHINGWNAFVNSTGVEKILPHNLHIDQTLSYMRSAYLLDAVVPGFPPIRKAFLEYARNLGFENVSVVLPEASGGGPNDVQDPLVELTNLNLIDTTTATWEQLLELRKDVQARVSLQRLRSFLTTHYSGKSRAFVEDDLAHRLDQYEQTRRKHGFDAMTGALGALLDTKNLQTAAAASIVGTLFGEPLLGLTGAVAIEVGHVSLEIAKRHRTILDWQSGHELAYLMRATSIAGDSKR